MRLSHVRQANGSLPGNSSPKPSEQSDGESDATVAHRIARRLADDGYAGMGRTAGPQPAKEILDISIIHVIGDVLTNNVAEYRPSVLLDRGTQIEQTKPSLDRIWILIGKHLRLSAVDVVRFEHPLIGVSGERHALLDREDTLELGRVRHGIAAHILVRTSLGHTCHGQLAA